MRISLCLISSLVPWALSSDITTAITSSQRLGPTSSASAFLSTPQHPSNQTQSQLSKSHHGSSSGTFITQTFTTSNKTPKMTVTTSTQSIRTGTTVQMPTPEPSVLAEIEIIRQRRFSTIIGARTDAGSISRWLASLEENGKWPDDEVDYTTGCAARRANWPAQEHWNRLVTMSSAWHGGLLGAEQFVKSEALRSSISQAMDYWFSRDLTNIACLDSGGTDACPCSNIDNSFWNTNWFSNIILIPDLVGQTCLLLNETLTPTQFRHCTNITGRSFGTFDHNINGVGFLTGANTLDVAAIGIDEALMTSNTTLLMDACRRVHLEMIISNRIMGDGIRADGAFGQHGGILYNGNYGKDFINDILDIEVETGGTQFAANITSQTAFATLFDGNRWMIYRNAITQVLHWDFSVLGRFISFPVVDNQATGSIKINLTQVNELGTQWASNSLIKFASSLLKSTNNANAGLLVGNRMFYTNDYMVHRGHNYITTVKMFSSRTQNTECVNTQNPMGFHLSDGAVHTYLRGNEYEDISVVWDWNLIPGITIDYQVTPLSCDTTQSVGVEDFVGGVSNGRIGLAAMRYTNPLTRSFSWHKVWFFLEDDIQHVMVANISSLSNNATVFSVLDQRRHAGAVILDDAESSDREQNVRRSLWHGDMGYSFAPTNNTTVSIQVGDKSGSWTSIGTSTQPPATIDMFAAWIEHKSLDTPVAYTVFPGVTSTEFSRKRHQLPFLSVQNDGHVSAVWDKVHGTAMIVFWDSTGGSVTFPPSPQSMRITVSANGNLAILYKFFTGQLVISDPSQTLSTVNVNLTLKGKGKRPRHWGQDQTKSLTFALPQGGLAGSSVTKVVR